MSGVARVKRGEIYWVNVPAAQTVGHEQHSRRPYVIVSSDSINNTGLVIGVPLTTNMSKACAYRIAIPANEVIKSSGAEYTENSVALTDQVRALDAARLDGQLGKLSDAAIISVGLGLSYVLSLDD